MEKWGNDMENKKINPLSVQSRLWLLDALLQLMREKPYNEITIKELTKRACLDRKTFYRHFKTKDDILAIPIREAFEEYANDLKQSPTLSSHEAIQAYFDLCLKHIDFFSLLDSHGLSMIILTSLSEFLLVLNSMFSDNPIYHKKTAWALAYEAGGLWNVTVRWINNGAKETSEEMATIIGSIMPPIFQE